MQQLLLPSLETFFSDFSTLDSGLKQIEGEIVEAFEEPEYVITEIREVAVTEPSRPLKMTFQSSTQARFIEGNKNPGGPVFITSRKE